MKIIFTGASSFTGYWIVKELFEQGHEVYALLTKNVRDYTGIRKSRIDGMANFAQLVPNCRFGNPEFLSFLQDNACDLFCHHASLVDNYRSEAFDPINALENNSKNLLQVLRILKSNSCKNLLLTGSYFEAGIQSNLIKKPAIYAYGLSKSLTWMLFQHYCNKIDIPLAKFVIPNPFGSLEESSRLIPYLMNSWLTNQTPVIDSPSYIRDNIPVTLLAKSYAWLINNLDINKVFQPSGYVGSQKKFVQKVMTEMSSRFNKKLNVTFKKQSFFTEPRIRTNSDNLNWQEMGWNESFFWDQLAEYYQTIHGVAQTSLKKSELIIC